MPIRYDQLDSRAFRDGSELGISHDDIVELVTAFRLYGFFRMDLDSGHLFATKDIYDIFGMEFHDAPLNLIELRERVHPDDLPMLMGSFERAAERKEIYHAIYRVRGKNGYKFARTVGKYREREGGAGEIVGIVYEFFERTRTIAFTSEAE